MENKKYFPSIIEERVLRTDIKKVRNLLSSQNGQRKFLYTNL